MKTKPNTAAKSKKSKATATTVGTSNFSTEAAAVSYYSAYGYSRREVLAKIAAGEISIGKPAVKPGEAISLHPREGRYFVTSPTM